MRTAIFATSALCILCALPGLTGCSTDQLYRIGQAWQRDQCQRIQDHQERMRCLAGASQSPDGYQREVEGLRRVGPQRSGLAGDLLPAQ